VLAPARGAPEAPREADHRAPLVEFCAALADALGRSFEPQDFDDYPGLLAAMEEGALDVAWLPPIVAMRAASTGRTLPIALPTRRGVSSFHSALFTAVGSTVQRPTDLENVRVAWVDRQSASGYLVIRAALRARGIDLTRAFGEEQFLGSHAAVAQAVLEGMADVGATFLHYEQGGKGIFRAGWGDSSVHIIARVGPIPADVIAAGVHVPVAEIRAVQRVLCANLEPRLRSGAERLMQAEAFAVAESGHLRPLEELLDFLEDRARPWESILPPPYAKLEEPSD